MLETEEGTGESLGGCEGGKEGALEAGRKARRRLWLGAFATGVGVLALALGTALPARHVVGLPLLLLFLPALSLAQEPLLRYERLERLPVYRGSILAILGLGALALLLALPSSGAVGLGLVRPELGGFLLWTAGMTAAGLGLVGIATRVGSERAGPPERLLLGLLPRTAREKRWFAGLSVAAGVGEELAFRGYLLATLQLLPVGAWPAAAISSAGFGLMHAYQGIAGILRTTAVGMLFAASVLQTGSLLPAMAAHALVDLVAGLVVGPRLIRRDSLAAMALDPPEEGG